MSGHGGVSGVDSGVLTPVLSWLRIGKVPILILIVIFLSVFGLAGITIQWALHSTTGGMYAAGLVSIPATTRGAVRHAITWAASWRRSCPRKRPAPSRRRPSSGRVATIVLGTARRGEPTQARLRDEHGRTHYVMVEPDVDGEEFTQGTEVLIVSIDGARFRVITPPSDALLE